MDGTLVNSLEDLADATNKVLSNNGYKTHGIDKYKYFVGDGMPKLIERALPSTATEEERARCLKEFLQYYSVHFADKTCSYEGMLDLVESLKARGIKTAVVSNKQQEMAQLVVEKIYGDKFDMVLGKRENLAAKPSADMLTFVCEGLGVLPSACAFVGDSGVDMTAALNAGMLPVGVLWGFRDAKELESKGARFLAKHAGELLDYILKL